MRWRTTPGRPNWRPPSRRAWAAKQAGDLSTATSKLGRAVQLATETGNREATTKLRKVVDVVDPGFGDGATQTQRQ